MNNSRIITLGVTALTAFIALVFADILLLGHDLKLLRIFVEILLVSLIINLISVSVYSLLLVVLEIVKIFTVAIISWFSKKKVYLKHVQEEGRRVEALRDQESKRQGI